jgi:hypothetical protein
MDDVGAAQLKLMKQGTQQTPFGTGEKAFTPRLHYNSQPGKRATSDLPLPAPQVQVQVCFTSVCGQVQPLDVALSNSV